ncbi:MAG: VWA domain-containing protein [Gammaproteobacteria bacterium]|nr:VWA domain-containing protein [Gammaproteobacteria bacterium]
MIEALAGLHWMRPLWLLALIPTILLFLLHWRHARHSSGWEALIDPVLLDDLLESGGQGSNTSSRGLPLLMASVALCIAIIAMAGPAWERVPQPPQRLQDRMVIVVDLSLSMYAEDVRPSRLTQMRYKLLELLANRREGQTALVAYSGDAHIVSPLTDDAKTIAAMVPALSPEIMPTIGSNAASAFELVNTLAEPASLNRIVWFTDDINRRDETAIAQLLQSTGAKLYILGFGTATGSPIPLPSGKFLKDSNGAIANARLPAEALQAIARKTGGHYLGMQADNSDINKINEPLLAQQALRGTQRDNAVVFDAWRDRGAALCLVLLPFALLSFRRGWLLSLCPGLALPFAAALIIACSLPNPAQAQADAKQQTQAPKRAGEQTDTALAGPGNTSNGAAPVSSPSIPFAIRPWLRKDQQAQRLLEQGKAQQAAELFEREDWRGVAAYSAGNYSAASEAFKQQIDELDGAAPATQADAHYNLGHALAKQGQLQEALKAYEQALAVRADFDNAIRAKSIVEDLLKQQAKQQQAGQQDNQEQDNQQQTGQQAGEQSAAQSGQRQSQQQPQQPQQQSQSGQSGQSGDPQEIGDSQSKQAQANSEPDRAARDSDFSGDIEDSAKQAAAQNNNTQTNNAQEQAQADPETTVDEVASAAVGEKPENAETSNAKPAMASAAAQAQEKAQLQQWLNKIEDDPGGLLRRKFQYQRELRERDGDVVTPAEDGKIW